MGTTGYGWHDRKFVINTKPNLDFCPHCGGTDIQERVTIPSVTSHRKFFYYECVRCGCRTGDCTDSKTARADWNRRVAQPLSSDDSTNEVSRDANS